MLLFLLIFSLAAATLTTACEKPAEGRNTVVEQTIATTDPKYIVCGFRFDGTRSQSPELFQKAVRTLDEQLPVIIDTFQCTVVRMTLFADDAGFAPTAEFRFPDDLLRAPDKKSETKKPQLTDNLKVDRELRAKEERKAEEQRAQKLAQARAELVRKARKWVTDNVRFLDRPCTAVREFVESLDHGLAIADVDIVVTDAQETCNPSPASAIVLGHPVVFVIVPTTGEIHQTAGVALRTAKALDQIYVNSESLMAYEIGTPMIWRELKHRIAMKRERKQS